MRFFAQMALPGSDGFGAPGTVNAVFEWDLEVDPETAPGTVSNVDVTDMDPRPEAGWTYDFDTETFTPYEGWVPAVPEEETP